MKKVLIFLIYTIQFLLFSANCHAQAPDWLWAKTVKEGFNFVSAIATDKDGDVYITGSFGLDSITFGNYKLINKDSYSPVFLVKYNGTGEVIWATCSEGKGSGGEPTSICTDALGNIYLTGWFDSDSIRFGSFRLISNSGYNSFIVKYDKSGNVIWATCQGGSGANEIRSITTDISGNAYIVGGGDNGTVIFGDTVLNFIDHITNFIIKYHSNGTVDWAKQYKNSFFNSVTSDKKGNIYAVGTFSDTATFDGYSFINPIHKKGMCLVKHDEKGNVIWAKAGIGDIDIRSISTVTDTSNNIIVTGTTFEQLSLDTIKLAPPGQNAFIIKYDKNGNILWAKNSLNSYSDISGSITSDISGNIFIAGTYMYTISFDSVTLNNINKGNMYIFKLNAEGKAQWAKNLDDGADGWTITIDAKGNLYAAGGFEISNLILDSYILNNKTGYPKMFIAKLGLSDGIENYYKNENVLIYPNPATDVINIVLETYKPNNKKIVQVFDLNGKEIIKQGVTNKNTQINMKENKEGLYILKITDKNNIITRKFIKLNN